MQTRPAAPAPRGWAAPAAALAWGLLGGVLVQLQQATLPGLSALAGAAVLAAVVGWAVLWGWRRTGVHVADAGGRWTLLALLLFVAATLGYASTAARAHLKLQDRLPAALEGVDIQVTGLIADLPRHSLQGTRFVFEPEAATLRGAPVRVPERLSLGWYRGFDEDSLLAGPEEPLRAGQRWHFTLRLRQPHGAMNPHGFDLELWMFERGLGASGYVRARPESPPEKLAEAAGAPVQRARQALRDALQRQVGEGAAADVLAALLIGDQAAIAREDWEVFRLTGVAHLMSISGLHVTMFAWLAGAAIAWLWRRSARAPLWLPAPQAARWGGLVCAAAYALLAGWGVPAQRTVGMIAVVVLLRTAGARWPLHAVLLAVALAVAMGDPWALLQPGFWLSFVAVALLVASEPLQDGPKRQAQAAPAGRWQAAKAVVAGALRGGLRTQAVATVGLSPLTLVFFQQLSLVGFAANLLAIPLVTLLVVPLAMAGVLLPPLWSLAAWLVQGLMALLQAMAAWPWALWQTAAAPPWALACGLLAGALAVLPLPPRQRWLAVPLLLPLLWPPVPRPGPGQFELVAADVGQGTAVLVRTQHHLLVYDAGPATTPEADAGSRVLLPLLRARGEQRIDLLMLSHRDTDHTGGAAALLAGLPVRELASSLEDGHPLIANAAARQLPHRACTAGQRWVWDGVQFELMHPPAEALATERRGKPNTLSCVLRVQATAPAPGGGPPPSALLTGDIEAAQEAALVQQHGAALASRLLLVPHHGSKTSSTPAFLQAVQPAQAVVQAAYRSRYGHPAPEVMARYEALGLQPLRSDRCGAYAQAADGSGHCVRQVRRRYWHHASAAPHPAPPAGRP